MIFWIMDSAMAQVTTSSPTALYRGGKAPVGSGVSAMSEPWPHFNYGLAASFLHTVPHAVHTAIPGVQSGRDAQGGAIQGALQTDFAGQRLPYQVLLQRQVPQNCLFAVFPLLYGIEFQAGIELLDGGLLDNS